MKNEHEIFDLLEGLDQTLIDDFVLEEERLIKRKKRRTLWLSTLSAAACLLLIVGLSAASPTLSAFFGKTPTVRPPESEESENEASKGDNPSPPSDRMYFSSAEHMLEWFFSNTGGQNQALQFAENAVMGEQTVTFIKQIVYGEKLLRIFPFFVGQMCQKYVCLFVVYGTVVQQTSLSEQLAA